MAKVPVIVPEHPEADSSERYTTETLMPRVYDELRKLAAWQMKRMQPGQTISATALLHEAYLRLDREADGPRWANRKQFFNAAAEAMRRFLIDRVRAKTRQKRAGNKVHTSIDEVEVALPEEDDRLLAVNEALKALSAEDPESANLVKLRFFAGFTLEEVAEAQGVSVRTVTRQWSYARAWLERHLERNP